MTRLRPLLISALTLGCLTASVASAQACNKTWIGGSGSYGTAGDWSPAGVPGSSDSVCITAPATVTIPANGAVAKTLTVGGGSGEATIDVVGESYDNAGNTSNETDLDVVESATFAANTKLVLDATNKTTETKVEPHGAGGAVVGGSVVDAGQIESVSSSAPWENRIKLADLKIEPGASLLAASGTLLFLKEGEGGYPWSVTNEGTFTVATGTSVEMQPSFSGKAGFINDGTVVNGSSITTHGAEWTQNGGSVSGNEVILQGGSTLNDVAGTGSFLDNYGTLTLTGTIPAGQTVTVRGEPYYSGGETDYSTTLSTGGKDLLNDGSLVLEAPGSGEVNGGNLYVVDGVIQNNASIVSKAESASRRVYLEIGLTNGPSGTLELQSGELAQQADTPTTNEGLLTIAPGAEYSLSEASTLLNTGTISPQIAGPTSYGTLQLSSACCAGASTFTAGGTLAPALLGGYVPSANQEFQVIPLTGGHFTGAFSAVTNGFTGDYSQEESETAYVGAIYDATASGAGAGTGTGTGAGSGTSTGSGNGTTPGLPSASIAHVVSVAAANGKLNVTLSCQAGGAACSPVAITATVTEHLKGTKITAISAGAKGNKKKSGPKTKQVTIASGGGTLAAGATQTVAIPLNGTGNALLAKYGKLSAILTVRSGAETLETTTVHLQKAVKKGKGKQK